MVIIFLILISSILSQKIIRIQRDPNNLTSLINSEKNPFYTKVEVGTPIQELKMNINFKTYSYYFLSVLASEYKTNPKLAYFNQDKSTSFIYDDDMVGDYLDVELTDGAMGYDQFKVGNLPTKEYALLLASQLNNFKTHLHCNAGILGFGPNRDYSLQFEPLNFITEAKGKKLILTKDFFLEFENENNAQIILGILPEDYNYKYYNNASAKLKTVTEGVDMYWGVTYEQLYYGNSNLNYGKGYKITIEIDDGPMITAIPEFNNTIYDLFFKKLIEKGDCEVHKNSYYICKKSVNIKNFKDITFYNKELDFNFTFTYKDLFQNFDNDKILFLIKFSTEYNRNKRWTFGSLFLMKYKVAFNSDSKTVRFYLNAGKNINGGKKGKNASVIILSVLLGLSVASFLFAVLYVLKMRRIKRKKRATEFDDDFTYDSKRSLNENNELNQQ